MQPPFEPLTNADVISRALEQLTVASDDPLPLLVELFDTVRPAASLQQCWAMSA